MFLNFQNTFLLLEEEHNNQSIHEVSSRGLVHLVSCHDGQQRELCGGGDRLEDTVQSRKKTIPGRRGLKNSSPPNADGYFCSADISVSIRSMRALV